MASTATQDSTASLPESTVATSSQLDEEVPSPGLIQISTVDELNRLIAGTTKTPLLIEFFADWCGPCKVIAAKLEEWVKVYEVTIGKIDVDELEDVAMDYNVAGIPTFVILKDKQKIRQLEGSEEPPIIEALEKFCVKRSDTNNINVTASGNIPKNLEITENSDPQPQPTIEITKKKSKK